MLVLYEIWSNGSGCWPERRKKGELRVFCFEKGKVSGIPQKFGWSFVWLTKAGYECSVLYKTSYTCALWTVMNPTSLTLIMKILHSKYCMPVPSYDQPSSRVLPGD